MSDQAPEILLAHHLKALKLPTCLREHHKLARQCAAEGVDHIRFLARLVEIEMIDRERRMVERRIKAARYHSLWATQRGADHSFSALFFVDDLPPAALRPRPILTARSLRC